MKSSAYALNFLFGQHAEPRDIRLIESSFAEVYPSHLDPFEEHFHSSTSFADNGAAVHAKASSGGVKGGSSGGRSSSGGSSRSMGKSSGGMRSAGGMKASGGMKGAAGGAKMMGVKSGPGGVNGYNQYPGDPVKGINPAAEIARINGNIGIYNAVIAASAVALGISMCLFVRSVMKPAKGFHGGDSDGEMDDDEDDDDDDEDSDED